MATLGSLDAFETAISDPEDLVQTLARAGTPAADIQETRRSGSIDPDKAHAKPDFLNSSPLRGRGRGVTTSPVQVPLPRLSSSQNPLMSAPLSAYPIIEDMEPTTETGWSEVAEAFDNYDHKLIQTGKDSIDSLLVFAGLFSAVLTALNVVSFTLLQDDPTDAIPLILAQISLQLNDLSINGNQIISVQPPFTPSGRFRATASNLVVNILWFTSLTLALISASVGILVKQWLQEYADLMSSQVTEHVCIRQYRFQALRAWRVSAIMKLLPLLLQLSLFLFFIGLSVLLWTVSVPVAAVVTLPMVIWFIFWVTSIVLPSIYGDCPYKSAESAIFFTLIQWMKPSLYSVLQYLYIQTDSRRLESLFRNLKKKAARSYGNWREREKDIVQQKTLELTQRTIESADEILMDEKILATSIHSYVQCVDVDEIVDRLLKLFLETAGCAEEKLSNWSPDGSRRTRSLIRATIEVLRNFKILFAEFLPENPRQTGFVQDDDFVARMQRRQLLVVVLGKYLYHCIGQSTAQPIIRDILDLPIYADFRGLSITSLRVYMMGVRDARLSRLDVQLPAINALAKSAVHQYQSEYWRAADSDYFAGLCMYLMRLVTRTSSERIAAHPDHLYDVKAMLYALFDFLRYLKEDPTGMQHGNNLLYLCEDMYGLVTTHPSFKLSLVECVGALLDLHVNPPSNMPPMDHSYQYRLQEHQLILTELCSLCDISCPPVLPLLMGSHRRSRRQDNMPASHYSPGGAMGSHTSIYADG